jgi:hypothetical protein
MLAKQWVRSYACNISGAGAHLLRARQHQAGLTATQRWHLSDVITAIPVFMHVALFLFLIGVIVFIWGDGVAIVSPFVTISVACLLLYVVITFLPRIFADCPFRTPFSGILHKYMDKIAAEEQHKHSPVDLDAKCLTWLMACSTTTSVVRSAAMAVSGLDGTPSQQKILYENGSVEVVMEAIASCAVENQGFLTIRHDALDTASLLLFAAQRLLTTNTSPAIPQLGLDKMTALLQRFDHDKFLDIRQNFDAGECAAALWCILAYRSLKLLLNIPPNRTYSTVDLVNRLPTNLSPPPSRLHH